MSKLTTLTDRPLRRLVEGTDLVVEADKFGLRLRAFGRRRWHRVSWLRILALVGEDERERHPVMHVQEKIAGKVKARELGITTYGK